MKTSKRLITFLLVALTGIATLTGQSKKEKQEQKKQVVEMLIASKDYKVNVSTAHPMKGRPVHLTSNYNIRIHNDSIFSYLPYYGRAYSIPYGGGEGLNFEASLKDYKMKINKKGDANIKLSARTPEDLFVYNITIFTNGRTSINVTMQNRQSIDFNGELDVPQKKKD